MGRDTDKYNLIKTILLSYRFWIIAILLFSTACRLWKLGSIPSGYQVDEVGSAYDAWCLLHYGVDRYRISWPVYFINYGGGQNALYTYLLIPCIALFGLTQFAIRLPAVFCSLLMAVCGLGIIDVIWQNYYGVKKEIPQLLFIILYAVAPYTQMSARLGLESLTMLGMSTAFLYSFLLAIRHVGQGKRKEKFLWFLSGLVGGITLYTYAISYLVLPLFLLLSLIYMIYVGKIYIGKGERKHNSPLMSDDGKELKADCHEDRIPLTDIIMFVLPLAAVGMPLVLEQIVNMTDGESFQIFGIFTVTKLLSYRIGVFTFSNIINNFILTLKSSLAYDWIDYNSTSRFWTFYPLSIPFFVIGVMVSFSKVMDSLSCRRCNLFSFPFIWFIAQFAVCCLLGENGGSNPNTNRVNGIFFTVMLFIVIGYVYCFRYFKEKRWNRIFAACMGCAYLVLFLKFMSFYFRDFNPQFIWNDTFEDVLSFIEEDEELSQKGMVVYINSEYWYAYYLVSTLPSPYEIDVYNSEFSFGNTIFSTDISVVKKMLLETQGSNTNFIIYQFYSFGDEWVKGILEEGFETLDCGEWTLLYSTE